MTLFGQSARLKNKNLEFSKKHLILSLRLYYEPRHVTDGVILGRASISCLGCEERAARLLEGQ